jgi:hypothetical protein
MADDKPFGRPGSQPRPLFPLRSTGRGLLTWRGRRIKGGRSRPSAPCEAADRYCVQVVTFFIAVSASVRDL